MSNNVEILRKGYSQFREQFRDLDVYPLCDHHVRVHEGVSNQVSDPAVAIPLITDVSVRRFPQPLFSSWRGKRKCARQHKSHMEHALKMGEQRVGPYYVDGYAESEGVRCAYEFQRCYFHSYPPCHRLEEI